MVKKYSELYMEARRSFLTVEDVPTASLYARILLSKATGKRVEELLANSELYASEEACLYVAEGIRRLLAGEPAAYVLGEWDFHGMRLTVTPDVLIPRDDTCAVTDLAINYALFLGQSPRILDLCTGSGCIGLAISKRIPDARVTLADISREAAAVAKQNIISQKASAHVSCVIADALDVPKPFLGKFDMIVSNPPYITAEEMKQLPDSVKCFEPHLALYGGEDGLDFYRAIARNYRVALKPGGYLCFEFGMGQGDDVCQILEENGYTVLERTRDYNQTERAVIAQYGRKED